MERNTPPGRNALVYGPPSRRGETDARRKLCDEAGSSTLNVLEITYKRTPEEVIADWRERLDGLPRRLIVLSLSGSSPEGTWQRDPGVVVTSVNPYSLTELGMRVQRCARLFDRTGGPVAVTLDSVTAMLQFVEERRAYRFLHTITGQFSRIGADAEFTLDPNAHEERTRHVLKTTFDEVRRPPAVDRAAAPPDRTGEDDDASSSAPSSASTSAPASTSSGTQSSPERASMHSLQQVRPGATPDAR